MIYRTALPVCPRGLPVGLCLAALHPRAGQVKGTLFPVSAVPHWTGLYSVVHWFFSTAQLDKYHCPFSKMGRPFPSAASPQGYQNSPTDLACALAESLPLGLSSLDGSLCISRPRLWLTWTLAWVLQRSPPHHVPPADAFPGSLLSSQSLF